MILLLQLKLLINGFRLLKVGGTLVYSTCRFFTFANLFPLVKTQPWSNFLIVFVIISLTVAQNEDVVEQFLKENASAGESLLHRSQKLMGKSKVKGEIIEDY